MVEIQCTESSGAFGSHSAPAWTTPVEHWRPQGENGLAQNRSVTSEFLLHAHWAGVSKWQPYSVGWITKASSVAAYAKQLLSVL